MYSLIDVHGKEIKKTKEVNKNIIKNIRHKEFVVVLLVKNKVRYILDDGIDGLAYFHRDIRSQ